MEVKVGEVAALLKGTVIGDADAVITGISSLAEAGPGDISFLANPRYAPLVAETRAKAVLMDAAMEGADVIQIIVSNPDFAFAKVVEAYGPQQASRPVGIHPTAAIADGVSLGKDVAIGAYAVINSGAVIGDGACIQAHVFVGSNAIVGAKSFIHPHVTIRENCELGERVIIHSGTVIGSDGFGYATVQGVHHKIPQVGRVVVGNDVEIGANTTIDRARFGVTSIGEGAKIDNLVQIAHNVEIGGGAILVSQVGIAGSSKIGRYVVAGGQSGVTGHVEVGDMARIAARAGVTKAIPPKATVAGFPAQDLREYQKQEIGMRRLGRTQAAIKDLTARIAELEKRLAEGGENA